jgi:H+/Na+-translocating ferredoxin:NAD+ oxidoreductase subunit B
MDTTERIYRSLQKHLDNQAVGYPATKSGVEVRLLKRFFTPDEARLAMHMTYKPASFEHICQSARASEISPESVQRMLRNMAMNGVINMVQKEKGTHYCLMPLIIGMAEGQLKRMGPELINEFKEYMSGKAFGLSQLATELPQLRFIPVGKSISAENRVSTYDQVTDLINGSKGPFAILECFCRKMADMKGQPCKKTSRREVCLAIGDNARNSIANGNGRGISREEALEITRMNEADGLVFETSNTQNIEVICSCCGCCCGPLAAQKMLPKPLDFAASNYQVWSDATTCSGCGTCVERCQVNAVTIDDGTHTAVVNLDRCLGCGNCVVTCPTGAMKLMKKQTETVPPRDMEALYDTIMANKKGPFGKMKLVLKLMLKR